MDGKEYLRHATRELEKLKALGESAMARVGDDDLHRAPDALSNSIAVLVRHLAGNMRSRWTDFLASDGEKPTRHRDGEFDADARSGRAELIAEWEEGWGLLFAALAPLGDADLSRTVTIRSEPHSVLQAIERQVAHYAYHVGQIVYLAKHLAGERFGTLSVPRGGSAALNAGMGQRGPVP